MRIDANNFPADPGIGDDRDGQASQSPPRPLDACRDARKGCPVAGEVKQPLGHASLGDDPAIGLPEDAKHAGGLSLHARAVGNQGDEFVVGVCHQV